MKELQVKESGSKERYVVRKPQIIYNSDRVMLSSPTSVRGKRYNFGVQAHEKTCADLRNNFEQVTAPSQDSSGRYSKDQRT